MGIDSHLTQDVYNADGTGVSETLYYHQNSRGDVVALTDSAGQAVLRLEYSAYGIAYQVDDNGALEEFSDFSLVCYGFQGRRVDVETGLLYFRNRFYAPVRGRWLSRDPLGYVDGYGLYAAFGQNPIDYRDPLGRDVELYNPLSWLGWGVTQIGTCLGYAGYYSGYAPVVGPPIEQALRATGSIINVPGELLQFEPGKALDSGVSALQHIGGTVTSVGEVPTSTIGFVNMGFETMLRWEIPSVDYYETKGIFGQTKTVCTYTYSSRQTGLSLGSQIFFPPTPRPVYSTVGGTTISEFQHEFGHTDQSEFLGPLYLFTVGVDYGIEKLIGTSHSNIAVEVWADQAALRHNPIRK